MTAFALTPAPEEPSATLMPGPPRRVSRDNLVNEQRFITRRQLNAALGDLFEVFGSYPARASMPHCAHCVRVGDIQALCRPLEHIPDVTIAKFVSKALINWGTINDFKRVLPELLTRTCTTSNAGPNTLIGAKLRRAGWLDWPGAEVPAIRRVLVSCWSSTLATIPQTGLAPATEWLSLVISSDDDLTPYLEIWEDNLESPGNPNIRLSAVLHLAEMLAPLASPHAEVIGATGRRRLNTTFPLARRGVMAQLDHWLRQPVVVRRLAHATDALADAPQGPRMSQAREGLAKLRTDR